VGAILTQNTNWGNVTRAIARLKDNCAFDPKALFALPERRLAEWIRPAGYFNVKARRLRAFLRVLVEDFGGDLRALFAGSTPAVRERLLAIHGVGPETADSMLLYAGRHHSFVVDAYTRRIFHRHDWCPDHVDYHDLQQMLAASLGGPRDAAQLDFWQDYHAQLVKVGSAFCRARNPDCERCPLKPLLPKSGAVHRESKP
jgi:endonuclease III related protein